MCEGVNNSAARCTISHSQLGSFAQEIVVDRAAEIRLKICEIDKLDRYTTNGVVNMDKRVCFLHDLLPVRLLGRLV